MKRNVLIVDDDRILRRLIQKKFEAHTETFNTLLAEDGTVAVDMLKEHPVSLVVTDLNMPQMDGFALLAHLSAKYPDIPVMILTAFGTPESKKKVLARGAAGFIEKPFVVEDLAEKVLAVLAKESEGGILQTVPLEMFIQLVEMEQKTCTLRVVNKSSGQTGVLFINDGQLMDARISDRRGLAVAHEILGWEQVSLTIEDTCVVTDKAIPGELQAILFDAMRKKDEGSASADEFIEPGASMEEPPPSPPPASRGLKDRIEAIVAANDGVTSMAGDDNWKAFAGSIQDVGLATDAGALKSCYLQFANNRRVVLVAEDPPIVLRFSDDSPQDLIRRLLYEWRT
jgi:CheY-like chemotaxis protein